MLTGRTRKFRDGKDKYWAKFGCRNEAERTSVKPFGLSSCHEESCTCQWSI